jgi:hypothetical protein
VRDINIHRINLYIRMNFYIRSSRRVRRSFPVLRSLGRGGSGEGRIEGHAFIRHHTFQSVL